jgi:hypothetical protein
MKVWQDMESYGEVLSGAGLVGMGISEGLQASKVKLYHGTTEDSLEPIMKEGINATVKYNPTFDKSFRVAKAFAGDSGIVEGLPEKGVVFELSVPRRLVQLNPNGSYSASTEAPINLKLNDPMRRVIPPKYIRAIYKLGGPDRNIAEAAYPENGFNWMPYNSNP